MKKILLLLIALVSIGAVFFTLFPDKVAIVMDYVKPKITTKYSVAQRLDQFGTAASQRLAPYFQQAGVAFPPTAITLLAFKDTKQRQKSCSHWQHFCIVLNISRCLS